MVASGTFGHTEEYYSQKEVRQLGAIVPKTVTLHAQQGNPPPRIVETASGMINAIGIENPGVDVFIENKLPPLLKTGVGVIVSILGYSDEEFEELARKFAGINGVSALELNLSCPNLKQKKLVAQDAAASARIVEKVKKIYPGPVIVKLTPNVTDISEIALAVQHSGADAVSMINTFTAMAIDVKTRRSCLGNVTGGLSGPAIKPAALYMVYRTAQRIQIPIIAMGGIMTAQDALEFIIAGATMVAVGTMNFVDPQSPAAVLKGIKEYMKKNKIDNFNHLIKSIEV